MVDKASNYDCQPPCVLGGQGKDRVCFRQVGDPCQGALRAFPLLHTAHGLTLCTLTSRAQLLARRMAACDANAVKAECKDFLTVTASAPEYQNVWCWSAGSKTCARPRTLTPYPRGCLLRRCARSYLIHHALALGWSTVSTICWLVCVVALRSSCCRVRAHADGWV